MNVINYYNSFKCHATNNNYKLHNQFSCIKIIINNLYMNAMSRCLDKYKIMHYAMAEISGFIY